MSLPPAGAVSSSPLSPPPAPLPGRVEPLGRDAAVGGAVHFQVERVQIVEHGADARAGLTMADPTPARPSRWSGRR